MTLYEVLAMLAAALGLLNMAGDCRFRTVKSAEKPMDDADLASRVDARICADSTLGSLGIVVTVREGRVFLSGMVDSDRARRRACELAYSAGGVREVVSYLGIRK